LHGRIKEEMEETIQSNNHNNTTIGTAATDESIAKAAEAPQKKKNEVVSGTMRQDAPLGGSRIQLKKCTR